MDKIRLLAAIADAEDDWAIYIDSNDGMLRSRVRVTCDPALGEIILHWEADDDLRDID
jgi:hypothetical protein